MKKGGPVVVNLPAKTFDVSNTLYVNFTGAAAPGTFTLRGEGTVLDCGRRTALALFVVGAGSVSISGLTIQNCTVQGLNGKSVLARACTARRYPAHAQSGAVGCTTRPAQPMLWRMRTQAMAG